MKNLLKVITVMVISMMLFTCDSDPLETEQTTGDNQETITAALESVACNNEFAIIKMVNNSLLETSFVIYDADFQVVLTEPIMQAETSSILKSIPSGDNLTIKVENETFEQIKNFNAKSCLRYTIVYDAENGLEIQTDTL